MNLEQYDIYKVIAHSLVFYSMKHKQNYNRLEDLCSSLQKGVLESLFPVSYNNAGFNDSIEELQHEKHHKVRDLSLDELMQKASEVFLEELHKIVQDFKRDMFEMEWPSPLLVIVAGPSSPRIGHPAMQYFSWLTKKETTFEEMSLHGISLHISSSRCLEDKTIQKLTNDSDKKDANNKAGTRFLYYVENPQNIVQTLQIGLGLYVEETVYSKYKNMNTDILAQVSHDYLSTQCKH